MAERSKKNTGRTAIQRHEKRAEKAAEPKNIDVTAQEYYLNRELSWLDFNARVLETALDEALPLLEQTKFLAIFYNNLDEFFMVHVANVLHQYREGTVSSAPDRMTPSRQLAEIRRKASLLLGLAGEHWQKKLLPRLRKKDVHLVVMQSFRNSSAVSCWPISGMRFILYSPLRPLIRGILFPRYRTSASISSSGSRGVTDLSALPACAAPAMCPASFLSLVIRKPRHMRPWV